MASQRHQVNRQIETLLVLTSQEKTEDGAASSNTKFTVHLNNSSKTHAIRAAHLLHAHIPNMFDNVRGSGNTFTLTMTSYVYGTSTQYTLTIPNGYYSLTELITAFNQAAQQYGLQVAHNPALAPPLNERLTMTFTPALETISTDLVSNYSNFTEVTTLPGPSNPVVSLPHESLPDNAGYVGMWMTVKEQVKFKGIQTIDYGPDTASIPATGTFAKWTGYVNDTTNGTPGYGTLTSSNNGLHSKAVDGVFSTSYLSAWAGTNNAYDAATGAYLQTTSTDVIANYGGLGYTAQPVLGEWVQFKFPEEVVINELKPYATQANEFTFAGSMDGIQWYYLTAGTGAQDNGVPPPNLASYSFNGTRVRYVRFIITNASNFTGGIDQYEKARVQELEMYVSAPYRRTHYHAIYRLDYHDPAYGNVFNRPSEIDRVDALDPANAAFVTQTQLKIFRTEEVSREGNVATHQEVDFSTGEPLDFSDPAYTLEPGYYYIVSKPPVDSIGQPLREGTWAINLAADENHTYAGVDTLIAQTEYEGDMGGGQVSETGIKIALGMGSQSTLGPIIYPYLIANYQLERTGFPTGTIQSSTAGRSYDLLTSTLGFSNNIGIMVNGQAITASLPFNLNGPDAVLLNSQCIAEGHGVGCGGGDGSKLEQNIIDMVSLRDTPRGQHAWYQPYDTASNLIRYRHSNDISRVDIEVTDTEGQRLTLPPNYHVVLVLRLIGELLDGV